MGKEYALELRSIPYKGHNGSFSYKCHCCGLMLLRHPSKHEGEMGYGNRNTAQALGSFWQRTKQFAKHSLEPGVWCG